MGFTDVMHQENYRLPPPSVTIRLARAGGSTPTNGVTPIA